MLVERYGFAGGMATAALVLPVMTFHAGNEQVITGIPQEVVDRLVRLGASPGHVPDPTGVCPTFTPVDPEYLKFVYQEMLLESGVDLMFHTQVTGVMKRGERVTGLRVQGKGGPSEMEAAVIVDATGDGDVAALAGAAYAEGREIDGLCQPATMMFRVGGVRLEKVLEYMKAHPDEFVLGYPPGEFERLPVIAVSGFFKQVEEAKARGKFPLERDRALFFGLPGAGEVIVNMTRVTRVRGTGSGDLTRAEIESRRQVFAVLDFLREYIPGFQEARLLATGAQVGVRESRRIRGLYTLTGKDVVNGRSFPDSVARGAYPIDIHDPSGAGLTWVRMVPGTSYDIPYRCLVPETIDGLLVAGRCLSADHEALASARISATAMALGVAAGCAAALAVTSGRQPREVDVPELQRRLSSLGASWGQGAPKPGVY